MVAALVVAGAVPAYARTNGDGLKLVLLNSADSLPNRGEEVTFELRTSASQPLVNLRCYQGQDFVYDSWAGFYDGAWFSQTFTLTSTSWTSGGADCTARLVEYARNGRERELARLAFHVYA